MANRTPAWCALAALTAGAAVAVVLTAPAAHAAGLSPFDVAGRGATVPFVEIEAEKAAHNGTSTGADRTYGKLSSEASGREAVTLDAAGEYVEFTLTKPANAVTFRYSIPDSANGSGRDATLDLRTGSTLIKTVPVTSKYSWYYGYYPFTNNPGDPLPHHFYDEARALFGTTYQAGTKIRLQVSSTAQSPTFTIDLADFELVADPIAKPSGAIDVVADYGADPTGATDSTAKFQAAVNAGASSGRVVYVPRGNFTLYSHVIVDRVTLAGAGPWYTVLGGRHPTQRNLAAGIYGKYTNEGGPSQNVVVRDLAVIGDIRERVDEHQVNAFGGAMSNSTIDNVWMQHTKVGAWMDGPMDRFTIRNSRILDQTADGVNFHIGVTNSTVTNTFVRNTGDDGLAMWAENVPNVGNSFTRNTVVAPILANHLVSYGGRDIVMTDNVVSESVSNGGGIHVGNRYPGVTGPTAVAGTWTLARNTLIRAGNSDYNWNFGIGALWFWGDQGPITGATINVTDTDILDSSYAAIQWIGNQTSGLNLTNVTIAGAGTFALQAQAPASARFTNVRASGIAQSQTVYNCAGSGLQIADGGGNSGWSLANSYCGPWPAPQWNTTPTTPPTTPPVGNLAAGRPATATSQVDVYAPANATDGNANTYWESRNNAFPQSITVDLGQNRTVARLVLKLPPATAWATRTQTLSVLGSTDGSSFASLKASAGYVFNPASANTATVTFPASTARYVRLTLTGNTGWPAGQLSEFEAYSS
ncbi:discoidin domain-containing protein [Actinoplanes sp. LDG1-06]|uniref:Discoidin domain-containing protein n=1 Tax=Paractinoplanes ovalisporus TaxID=2810368 RepID=A0ABS2ASQ4_9ACTN|nr:discoidin domain-containing protein [Actinoplanes ovalisporus]MBM2622888.1 discoidin domain-containing protein [Actinoplanes ovalisporus]